ncbi:unnamed protein product [Rotaria sp. Silwood2]|nr:unnamed protein product [Rotaria sp. Silwood2]CAF2962196.1 unnamed protein product [Rotaria sp. Silwood2]CAF3400628.1 unnamed protein product [Rotaria sp. Silwood2]CAF4082230.1 unnamed protein product [Rotaria sp. Silwood2]CAF4208691.1 unnamed protein product [Rotaria sp. Silwood2]
MLVLISGEQETYIRDDTSTIAVISDYQNRHHLAVTLFADSLYLIRIHLDCPRQYGSDSPGTDCNIAHRVDVWIDLNNDGNFDESENQVHRRSPIDSETRVNGYDLTIFIPQIDGTNTKAGHHRMRLSVMRSEDYQRQCGSTDYSETREYTVNIVPRKTCAGKICTFIDKRKFSCNLTCEIIFISTTA